MLEIRKVDNNGRLWDIRFNSSKNYIITFGDGYSSSTRISLDDVDLKIVVKLKYLGCYFCERTCKIAFSYGITLCILTSSL